MPVFFCFKFYWCGKCAMSVAAEKWLLSDNALSCRLGIEAFGDFHPT
jgi:hypothetical protein